MKFGFAIVTVLTLISFAFEETAVAFTTPGHSMADDKDDGQQGDKDDGQQGDKDDGQQGDKDDGQQGDKDDGQQGDKDDG